MNIIEELEEYVKLYQQKIYSINYRPYITLTSQLEEMGDAFFSEFDVTKKEVEMYMDLRKDYIISECNKRIKREREKAIKNGATMLNSNRLKVVKKKITEELEMKYINDKVDKENEKLRALESEYKKHIKSLSSIIKKLNQDFPKINIDEIDKLLLSTDISPIEKLNLNSKIESYVEEKEIEYQERKQKEKEERIREKELKRKLAEERKVEVEEIKIERKKTLKDLIKNFDYIEPIFITYNSLIPDDLEETKLEEFFTNTDLKEILNMKLQDIDSELFQMVTITILFKINETTDINIIETYIKYYEIICKKYQLINQLDKLDKTIQSIYTNFACTDEDSKTLYFYQNEVLNCKTNTLYSEELANKVDDMEKIIHSIRTNNLINNYGNSKIPIKSFILFDYSYDENNELKSYITTDLDENSPKSMIDSSIDKSKIISNGYNDFNELIEDLLLFGKPKVLAGQTDKLDKIVRPIYNTTNNYERINTSMGNSTGMYRIKPHVISNVRFIDEKVKLIPNTEKFNQIKELLESKLGNICISESEPFDLYINYLTGFKLKDFDSYKTAQNRQENSEIRNILKNKNNSYTNDELELLSKVIDVTLITFKDLESVNENFDFKVVDKLHSNQILS